MRSMRLDCIQEVRWRHLTTGWRSSQRYACCRSVLMPLHLSIQILANTHSMPDHLHVAPYFVNFARIRVEQERLAIDLNPCLGCLRGPHCQTARQLKKYVVECGCVCDAEDSLTADLNPCSGCPGGAQFATTEMSHYNFDCIGIQQQRLTIVVPPN